jgi:hypothetical protein
MRVVGEWLPCDDGINRPSITGLVCLTDEQWTKVTFLLDSGADRTVFGAEFLSLLQPLESFSEEQIHLAGVGGPVGSITIETAIGFIRDDERLVRIRGRFSVFTNGSGNMSVLGRDVTNNFSVIYDYPNQSVALLASPHYYEIKQ